MQINIIPFEVDHLKSWCTGDEIYDSFFISYVKETRDHDKMFSAFSPMGYLIGIGGLDTIWTDKNGNQYGDAWMKIMQIDDWLREEFAMRIRYAFKRLVKQHKFKRIQAMVEKEFAKGNCLAELLGFVKEGVMRNAPPNGKDSIMYGMVF